VVEDVLQEVVVHLKWVDQEQVDIEKVKIQQRLGLQVRWHLALQFLCLLLDIQFQLEEVEVLVMELIQLFQQ
jgi:hypothetical protein